MKFLGRLAGFFIRQENMDGSGTDNEDRLSNLPDSLLCEILLQLSTKDVVRCSVLSSRWGNLWRSVPGLDLSCDHLREYDVFVSVVDRFLGFNSESYSCIENLKLKHQLDSAHVARWINTVVNRKVKHLDVISYHWVINEVHIPSTVYTCESLVTLQLHKAILPSPKFVFLPCLKVIYLNRVKFANDLAFEMLISGCPVLESLSLVMNSCDNINCFRVCSKSLLRLSINRFGDYSIDKDLVVDTDAPRLRYLKLSDYNSTSFIVNNLESLVKVDIDIGFKRGSIIRRFDPNNLPKINMIGNFFNGISTAKHMVISSRTLEVIYDYLRCQPLPLFLNLSSMRVPDNNWQMLPAFLESCPNLKSLVLEYSGDPEKEGISILSGRQCFMSSLEYVEIERPLTGLVTYFLDNSTLCLDDSRMEGESVILSKDPLLLQYSLPQEIDSILG